MGWTARRASDLACLKAALRTLKMTTPIARHPTRVFQALVGARELRDAPAPSIAASATGSGARQPICTLTLADTFKRATNSA